MDMSAVERAEATGDYVSAIIALDELRAMNPDSGEVSYHQGRIQRLLGNRSEAVTLFRSAIAFGLPDGLELHAIVGLVDCLASQKRNLEAVRELRGALTRHPGEDGLRTMLALLMARLGMHRDAMALLVDLLLATTGSGSIRDLAGPLDALAHAG